MRSVWLGKSHLVNRLSFGLAALVVLLMLGLLWATPAPLVRLNQAATDWLFWLRGTRPVPPDIVLVGIDERSLKEEGRWPWSRAKQASLIHALAGDSPRVMGLDIIYAEPEGDALLRRIERLDQDTGSLQTTVPALRQFLQEQRAAADVDGKLANSLRAAGNVVVALALSVPESGKHDRPAAGLPPGFEYLEAYQFALVKESGTDEAVKPFRAAGASPPLKRLAEAAASAGHVYSIPDPDGVTRYEYLALRYGEEGDVYPSLPLEVARLYLGVPRERMVLLPGQGIQLGELFIPTDQKSRLPINYLGREGTILLVSATDVLHGRVPAGTFAGKIVVVGTAALGAYDQKATPLSANFSGIEKNATVVENIIHGRFLTRTLWSGPLEVGAMFLLGFGLAYVLPRASALRGGGAALALALGYVVLVQWLFAAQGVVVGVLFPLLTVIAIYLVVTVLRFMTVEKERGEIRALFTPYVGPQIVEELINNPEKARQGSRQRREVTLLFCDVVGFVKFCESHTVDEIVNQMNEYLGAMTDAVFHWGGTLIDFKGDEVYALWGAPLEQPDHAERAAKCAIQIRARLAELNRKWEAEGRPQLQNGVGLNTGQVLFANMGAEGKRMKFEAVGDSTNLASRTEGLTRKFGVPILMTEYTAERVKPLILAGETPENRGRIGHVLLRRLAPVLVKGKAQPVIMYELRPLGREEPSRIEEPELPEVLVMTDK
jgi:adenylate cyclase